MSKSLQCCATLQPVQWVGGLKVSLTAPPHLCNASDQIDFFLEPVFKLWLALQVWTLSWLQKVDNYKLLDSINSWCLESEIVFGIQSPESKVQNPKFGCFLSLARPESWHFASSANKHISCYVAIGGDFWHETTAKSEDLVAGCAKPTTKSTFKLLFDNCNWEGQPSDQYAGRCDLAPLQRAVLES